VLAHAAPIARNERAAALRDGLQHIAEKRGVHGVARMSRRASGPIPKFASFVRHPRLRTSESRTTSNSIILVPLLNPKFAVERAARDARTSGSGH
jgi:hypothetical protein